METMVTNREHIPPGVQAQAEVYWLAFQALPFDAQLILRERVMWPELHDSGLATELASWQAAASETLRDFEELYRQAIMRRPANMATQATQSPHEEFSHAV